MKCVSKKFLAALLACAVAWMAWAPGAAFARAGDNYDIPRHKLTVTLVNKTNATITVYLSRKEKARQSSYDSVDGPYSVEPGKKRTVSIPDMDTEATPNDYNAWYQHGFYATSSAGRVWAGEKKKGIDVCIFDSYWSLKSDVNDDDLKRVKKVVVFQPFLIWKDINASEAKRIVGRHSCGYAIGVDYNTTLTFTDKGVSIGNQGNANAKQQKKPAAKPAKPAAQQQKKPAAQPAKAPADQQIKLMSTFLSNFTEVGLFDLDVKDHLRNYPSHPDLIAFGIMHNYINNRKSRIKSCPIRNCEDGSLVVEAKFVAESVKKYFDINLEHDSIEDQTEPACRFDGKLYHFDAPRSGAVYYAEVKKATRKGDVVHMSGDIYNTKNKNERPYTFEATAKPYKWNGKDTWALLSLKSKAR